MGKIIEIDGNLFHSKADAIGHGVNTVGAMGAGIAKAFSSLYPEMYEEYKLLCRSGELVAGGAWVWSDPTSDDIVLNIASQDRTGANARLDWLKTGLVEAIAQLRKVRPDSVVIALNRIGAGIGGLKWDDVREVIVDIAESEDIDIEIWNM